MSHPLLPLRYDVEVPPDGRIEVQLPLPTATHVTIFVVEKAVADLGDPLQARKRRHDALRSEIDRGIQQLESGDCTEFDSDDALAAYFQDVASRGKDRVSAKSREQ